MTAGKYISKNEGEKMVNPSLYRSAIGRLQDLEHTRPDSLCDEQNEPVSSCTFRYTLEGSKKDLQVPKRNN